MTGKTNEDFELYLTSLLPWRFSIDHVDAIRELWKELREVAPALPLPVAFPIGDEALQLSWTRGPYHLSVDVYPTTWDWFFHDRAGGETDGGDNQDGSVKGQDSLLYCLQLTTLAVTFIPEMAK